MVTGVAKKSLKELKEALQSIARYLEESLGSVDDPELRFCLRMALDFLYRALNRAEKVEKDEEALMRFLESLSSSS